MPVEAYTRTNLTRSAMPAVTMTEGISIADLDNIYRPRFFLNQMGDIEWLNNYDSPVMRFYDAVGNGGIVATQPKVEWTEASRLQTASPLATAISSTSSTSVVLEDAGIANVGQFIFVAGGEWMEVTAQNLSTNTLTVVRGAGGTQATTHAVGTSFIAAPQFMGEKDIPLEGTGTMPGLPQYNFASIYARTWKSTRLNNGTVIEGDWGKMSKEQMFAMFALRHEVAQASIFSPRYVEDLGSRGPRYLCGGIVQYVKSNIFNMESDPSKFTWENINQVAENSFRHDASSRMKVVFCGRNAFFAFKKTARDENKLGELSSDAVKLGTDDYVIETDYGPWRMVLADRELPQNRNYNLGDWAIGLDPANIASGTLTDFGSFQIVPDIQTPRQGIMVKEDACIGSFWVAPKFEQTHFIIKGAPTSLNVVRSELL